MKKIIPILFLITGAEILAADKAGKLGSEFSYSGSIGIFQSASGTAPYTGVPGLSLWYHFTERFGIALRTGYYSTNYEAVNSPGTTYEARSKNTVSSFGVSIEVPIYVAKLNLVELYLAPAVGYTFSTVYSKSTYATSPNSTLETKYINEYLSAFGVVGLQVPLLDQLHILARTTFGYIYGDTNQDALYQSNSYTKNSYFGFQSWSLGAIIYFN